MGKPTYVIVTGGVLSGLGKGIAVSSIGKLLNLAGKKVVPIKCEGYLNIDPGTMNPIEHGEVFVLDDGEEADMDFGHYERMMRVRCQKHWNITMGKVYQSLFEKERRGDFLGKTVQMIPHVTDEIKQRWQTIGEETKADVVIIEIGGTVGDIETEMYIEAARQLKLDKRFGQPMYVHLTYVPTPDNVGEPKTKPTQQSVSLLRKHGIIPDIIITRGKSPVTQHIKQKIALFCDVPANAVISGHDVKSVYEVPLLYAEQGILDILRQHIKLPKSIDVSRWKTLVHNLYNPTSTTTIAICGKYTALEDSYASVIEALSHAGAHHKTKVDVVWIDTESVTPATLAKQLKAVDGVIVPGGFGTRGVEGKINAINVVRTNNIPYLGICYGLQLAVIEYARNVCKLQDAHTREVQQDTIHPIVTLLDEQTNVTDKGGTMRLGAQTAHLTPKTKIHKLYKEEQIQERHRHRYEVNPAYHSALINNGMVIAGKHPQRDLVEFIELADHPYFVATQAHPELLSTLEKPAPLFMGLIKAAQSPQKK